MAHVLRNLDTWDTVGLIVEMERLDERPRRGAPDEPISGVYGRVGKTLVGLCLLNDVLFLIVSGRLVPLDWDDRVEYRQERAESVLLLSSGGGVREIVRYPTPRPDEAMRQAAFWGIEDEDVGRWLSNVTSSPARKSLLRQVWSGSG